MEVDLSAFDFDAASSENSASPSPEQSGVFRDPSLRCPPGVVLGSPLAYIKPQTAIGFDIETGPLPLEQILEQLPPFKDPEPYKEFKDPGPFDEGSVKYGNAKDPAKRKEILETKRARHVEDCANAQRKWEEGKIEHAIKIDEMRAKHQGDFVAGAALRAETARILAIGYSGDLCYVIDGDGRTESEMLVDFWKFYEEVSKRGGKLFGHYIKKFDLPMIVRRSWINGLAVPETILKSDRYWAPCFIDTIEKWGVGEWGYNISLNRLARVLGVGSKEEGAGAKFAQLWETDRYAALQYLNEDLELTVGCGIKLGIA